MKSTDKRRLAEAMKYLDAGNIEGAKKCIQVTIEENEGFFDSVRWHRDDILQAFIDSYGGDAPILVKVKERLETLTDDEMEYIASKMGELTDAEWIALRDLFEANYLEE